MIFLFLFCLAAVVANPLSGEENKRLQRECGRTYIRARYAKSANSPLGARYIAPFTVQLNLLHHNGSSVDVLSASEGICTGTMISPRHVLTSASCVASYQCSNGNLSISAPFLKTVPAGVQNKTNYLFVTAPLEGGKWRKRHNCGKMADNLVVKPKQAFISKDFALNGCGFDKKMGADIAVVELEEDLNFSICIQPACLYSGRIEDNQPLTLYGYGETDEVKYGAGRMRKQKSKTVPKEECSKTSYPWYNEITGQYEIKAALDLHNDQICTKNERTMTCLGDRGGGLILKHSYLAHVAAVNSWGPPCLPDFENFSDSLVDVNTGIYNHLDWICTATGICPRGNLTEKSQLKEEYFTVSLTGNLTTTELNVSKFL